MTSRKSIARYFYSLVRRRRIIRERQQNQLSTRFGRFIENISYLSISLSALGIILLGSIYFFLATEYGHGLKGFIREGGIGFDEAIYFSVVTFTTLGYGEIHPEGYGRLVAALEVLFGLVLTALFIGKISSERQSALLLLVYTSDQQRRLTEFSTKIEHLVKITKERPSDKLDSGYQSWFLWKSLSSYLMFHANQGRITEFGNKSALRQLYRLINELLQAMLVRMKSDNIELGSEENFRLSGRVYGSLAGDMISFYKPKSQDHFLLRRIEKTSIDINNQVTNHLIGKYQSQVSDEFQNRKKGERNYHKIIASKLGINEKIVIACIKRQHDIKRKNKNSVIVSGLPPVSRTHWMT